MHVSNMFRRLMCLYCFMCCRLDFTASNDARMVLVFNDCVILHRVLKSSYVFLFIISACILVLLPLLFGVVGRRQANSITSCDAIIIVPSSQKHAPRLHSDTMERTMLLDDDIRAATFASVGAACYERYVTDNRSLGYVGCVLHCGRIVVG